MFKQSRFIEISLEKEIENEYEYMLKINLPDKNVIYQKARITEMHPLEEPNDEGLYECSVIFTSKFEPEVNEKNTRSKR